MDKITLFLVLNMKNIIFALSIVNLKMLILVEVNNYQKELIIESSAYS